jgi:hypothetical protein
MLTRVPTHKMHPVTHNVRCMVWAHSSSLKQHLVQRLGRQRHCWKPSSRRQAGQRLLMVVLEYTPTQREHIVYVHLSYLHCCMFIL